MELAKQKQSLVKYLEELGLVTPEVKKALMKVRREMFIPEEYRQSAYEYNVALPIPGGVTISAMNMHVIILSAAELKPSDKVLEIGAGSGILLAYLQEIVGKNVYGIETIPETYEFAKRNLEHAGYGAKLFLGDGSEGLPQFAPYDKIISSASSPSIPQPWIKQLKTGGILITPTGPSDGEQRLILLKKAKEGLVKKDLGRVAFVELKGRHGWK